LPRVRPLSDMGGHRFKHKDFKSDIMTVTTTSDGLGASPARASDPVRSWLGILVVLVIAMVAVGGATRLTGSGLSITEWKPVTGAIPPLSHEAWEAEFSKYRQIPQYQLLNRGMSLDEFKSIYWWEWGHRQLGRFIGLAFFVPLVWFWARGQIRGRFALGLVGLGVLGGMQGAVGWIMVASGLEPGMTAVAPIKLMLHLTIASAILAGLVWLLAGMTRQPEPLDQGAVVRSRVLLGLVLLQIALGGLVAGSKAGFTYNTWPLMDGQFVPPVSALLMTQPWIQNFVHNVVLVQFNHRLVAYFLVVFTVWHAWRVGRSAPDSIAARGAWALAGLVLAQMVLGIVTLLLVVPLWAGLAHQILAMLVLCGAVVHARWLRAEAVRPIASPALA